MTAIAREENKADIQRAEVPGRIVPRYADAPEEPSFLRKPSQASIG